MQPHHTGYVVFLAALGVMAALVGNEVSTFQHWNQVLTPAFIGKTLIHVGTVVGAFVGGKLIPTTPATWTGEERRKP